MMAIILRPTTGQACAELCFAHPYFYRSSQGAEERISLRSSALCNKTVQEVFRECFDEHELEAIELLARSIWTRASDVRHS